MNVVNSWNEWDPLQEVIVGTARGAFDIGFEPALAPYFSMGSPEREFRGRPAHPMVVDDAERQLDHFADLLDRLGITVRRPDLIDHGITVQTPAWQTRGGHASACPPD